MPLDPTIHRSPDLEPLKQYVLDMPGGEFIGDKWLTQPVQVVGVRVYDDRMPDLINRVIAAYPPAVNAGFSYHRARSTGFLVFVVPKLIADMLAWDDRILAHVLPAGHQFTTPVEVNLLAHLWEDHPLSEEEGFADLAAGIASAARFEQTDGTPAAQIIAAARILWDGDDREASFADMVEAAALTSRSPLRMV
jgi:hypothetical protein